MTHFGTLAIVVKFNFLPLIVLVIAPGRTAQVILSVSIHIFIVQSVQCNSRTAGSLEKSLAGIKPLRHESTVLTTRPLIWHPQ